MSIKVVQMYRVVCDEPGCEESAQDGGDFFAWVDRGSAIDEATNADWTIRPDLDLCTNHGHRTVCMGDDEECPRRDVSEADDGWMYCPEHADQGRFEESR